MSTSWYFECMDHTPALRSSDEFTQHTDDHSFKRAVELANSRPIFNDWTDRISLTEDYFTANACRFLIQHPACRLGVVSEYNEHRLLDEVKHPVSTEQEDRAAAQQVIASLVAPYVSGPLDPLDVEIADALIAAGFSCHPQPETTEWEYQDASHWEDHGWVKDPTITHRRVKHGDWIPVVHGEEK